MPLYELVGSSDGPRSGDVVAFWRHAQDLDGRDGERLRAGGVTVEWAEARIDDGAIDEIDEFVDRFGRGWHLQDGVDVTRSDGFSFGDAATAALHSRSKVNFLVRYGVIFERLFDAYPDTREVLTDFRDGVNWLTGDRPAPEAFQRRSLLGELAVKRNIAVRDLDVACPLPPLGFHGREPVVRQMIRSFIGGVRPGYLIDRMRLRWIRKRRPRAYLFMSSGLDKVAETLASRGDVLAMADRDGIEGVFALRYDHLLALPPLSCIAAAFRLWRRVRAVSRSGFPAGLATYGSIDFTPYFLRSLRRQVRHLTVPTLVAAGQVQRMYRIGQPDIVEINGEGSVIARLTVGFAARFNYRVVFIDHSNTLVHYGYHPVGRNFTNVIYVAQGEDHVESYGRKAPDGHKPWRPVLTNPAGTAVAYARGKRRDPPGKRVLFTNYSGAPTYSVARFPFEDRFMIDLIEAARMLIAEGYSFTYRQHPGFNNPDYVRYLLDRLGMADHVALDGARTFGESLLNHDLVVANVSGCYYQALCAGWPTIFHEPGFEADRFVGLPGATDIERPISSTPEELARLIRSGLEDPNSLTARFPTLFNTVYAARFAGRDADRAHEVLADFMAEEVLGLGRSAASKPDGGEALAAE